ncbi:MAG: hypothetical protein HY903_20235 [Deltaproteobacteria bacterium]|nr:hypothetical protein [Deltaproteobacteria bacterium]
MRRIANQETPGGGRRIVYEHEWREAFVGEALTLDLGADRQLQGMELYSAELGIVRWSFATGLGEARAWENEDDLAAATSPQSLARHFPTLFIDGRASAAMAPAIVERVLARITGSPLERVLRQAIARPEERITPSSDELRYPPDAPTASGMPAALTFVARLKQRFLT